jgi:hypothetical protein
MVERARCATDGAGGNLRIARRCVDVAMSEQRLDDADVGATFQQMGKAGQGSGGVAVGMPDEGAKLWRNVWTVTRLASSAAAQAERQAAFSVVGWIGCSPS